MIVTHEDHPTGPVIALVGPTAVGKSECALTLAQRLPLEIINADSRQVYRYMDIGTSKPTSDERERVSHHVLDVVDPNEEFSLSHYLRLARHASHAVAERGRIPLVVGGTGQYVWSLAERWQVPEVPPDREFRTEMQERVKTHGPGVLHAELTRIDAEAGARIHEANVRRVIRALELFRATGEKPSVLLWRRQQTSAHSVVVIGLALDRPALIARADARIDRMMRHGFAAEVRSLLDRGYSPALPSMSSIGYREVADYVSGRCDLDGTMARVRRETRRLIRRQHAWFRPTDERIRWLDWEQQARAVEQAIRIIEGAVK